MVLAPRVACMAHVTRVGEHVLRRSKSTNILEWKKDGLARSFTSTWMLSMPPSSSATIPISRIDRWRSATRRSAALRGSLRNAFGGRDAQVSGSRVRRA